MGKGTNIEWADDTANPTSGCDGCELWSIVHDAVGSIVPPRGEGPCYAGNLHEKRLAKSLPELYDANFFNVRTIAGRAKKAVGAVDLWDKPRPEKPWLGGYPRVIFWGDLGDIFSKNVPFDFLADELIGAIRSPKGRLHGHLLLTKQPGRAAMFARWLKDDRGIDWPANIWTGTSITSRASLRRIDALCHVPGRRFLSVEPLVEDVTEGLRKYFPTDIANWQCQKCRAFLRDLGSCPFCGAQESWLSGSHAANKRAPGTLDGWRNEQPIDWMIVGGESSQWGRQARPFDLRWARGLRDLCNAAIVPYFVKQVGSCPIVPYYDVDDDLREWALSGRYEIQEPGPAGTWSRHEFGFQPDIRARIAVRLGDHHGGDLAELPEDLRIREMPSRRLFRAA